MPRKEAIAGGRVRHRNDENTLLLRYISLARVFLPSSPKNSHLLCVCN
ncbi:hypothetical protein IQ276_038370 [Desmonostoc muscorum LEGE 12446]|uniref:Uncharacterized protein n=1 Tax=Desmonostoc muscorum LEGE 12446 TaxID=1828758 RepID=A0A8J6ZZW8_DESMC|nr:hypothetical protein [Desmonostoc muscorum]MCF2152158.1 hypothetical protein [Desmonostoc muscorum LEGE 12446]